MSRMCRPAVLRAASDLLRAMAPERHVHRATAHGCAAGPARQFVQFEPGGCRGPPSEVMQKVVSRLTLNDMISMAAYMATLKP